MVPHHFSWGGGVGDDACPPFYGTLCPLSVVSSRDYGDGWSSQDSQSKPAPLLQTGFVACVGHDFPPMNCARQVGKARSACGWVWGLWLQAVEVVWTGTIICNSVVRSLGPEGVRLGVLFLFSRRVQSGASNLRQMVGWKTEGCTARCRAEDAVSLS